MRYGFRMGRLSATRQVWFVGALTVFLFGSGTIDVRAATGLPAVSPVSPAAPAAVAAPSPPTLSPTAGTYTVGPKITLTSSAAGASIYYTTDGSTPTSSSKRYSAPFSLPTTVATWKIQAIAVLNGVASGVNAGIYTVAPVLAAPIIHPVSGTYNAIQTITFAPPPAGANIHYTVNGQAPTTASKTFAGETISLGASGTVRAVVMQPGYTQSAMTANTYAIVPSPPVTSPAPGTYTTAIKITLSSSTPGAVIYYTKDDSTPTTSSAKYTSPLSMPLAPALWKIRAIAVLGGETSAVTRELYTVAPMLGAPTIHPAPGTYNSVQTLQFATPPAGATIHYTLNGDLPTSASKAFAGETIRVGVSATVEAIVTESGYTQSPTTVNAYKIVPPTPVIAPGSGTYATGQKVTLSTTVPGTPIHYTTDGSEPTASSHLYTASIPVMTPATTTVIRAVSAINGAVGSIASAQITIAETSSTYTETPAQSDALVDSIGVNVHLGFLGTPYQNFALVQNALKTLGVRHVRDGLEALPSTWPGYFQEHNALGQSGIDSIFITSVGQPTSLWVSYPGLMANCFAGFENPNEYDNNGITDWVTPLTATVKQLSSAVRNGAITPEHPVYGPALVNQASYPELGNISSYFDFGNLHNYPGGQNPGSQGWGAPDAEGHGYGSIGWQLDNLAFDSPGLPVTTTETGYTNDLTLIGSVPQSVAAVYMPRMILQQWLANIKRTYRYELVYVGGEDYGLYAANWSAKPAVAAIANLTGLLSDPGAAFAPAPFTYTIKGADSNLHHLLLQKRNGTYYLALWLEESSYNTSTATVTAVQPENIQLILPANFQATGYQWDDTGAANPVAIPVGSSPAITVTDNLLLLQLTE
jgi:hypothetical protein